MALFFSNLKISFKVLKASEATSKFGKLTNESKNNQICSEYNNARNMLSYNMHSRT